MKPVITAKPAQKTKTPKKQASTITFEAKKTGGQDPSIGNLTPKQEKFAQLVASGKSLSDAYRGAYSVGENTTADSINVRASEAMAVSKVSVRVDELRAQIMAKVAEEVSYEYRDAMDEADEALAFARECKNPATVLAATAFKARISGLMVEDRANERNPVSGMSSERVKAALNALGAMRKAKAAAIA